MHLALVIMHRTKRWEITDMSCHMGTDKVHFKVDHIARTNILYGHIIGDCYYFLLLILRWIQILLVLRKNALHLSKILYKAFKHSEIRKQLYIYPKPTQLFALRYLQILECIWNFKQNCVSRGTLCSFLYRHVIPRSNNKMQRQ